MDRLTTVLQSSRTPEPLSIELWNEHPAEAAELVRAILAECHDGEIPLKVVRVPAPVWAHLSKDTSGFPRPSDSRIEVAVGLQERLEFWREEPSSG